MPKLYEYFGLIIMFYANEHEPVHVHGKYQDRESRAEIIVVNGEIVEVRYAEIKGVSIGICFGRRATNAMLTL